MYLRTPHSSLSSGSDWGLVPRRAGLAVSPQPEKEARGSSLATWKAEELAHPSPSGISS